MKFTADLHLHSHFSRATAKNLDLEHLYVAARLKGVSVVGTGDFTHPGWIKELEEKLIPAEPGLFKLKDDIEKAMDKDVPPLCIKDIRFILQTEISSIYKKNNRVRKNHNLLYFPDIDIVKTFNAKLEKIGNIKSDGRPILGLDAEKLLEIMLDTSEKAFLIPAHIWTPWFSMFGAKSGFDSIKECFGSLADHIFAVETGLSSDPPMNWRVKDLDRVRLISNSDAHSPGYLGRNASMFDTDLSYDEIRNALEQKDSDKFSGTIDMYPEEGKYHFDGHRKCNICFNPEQTIAHKGICPECGKPLTLGVLHRVQELACRSQGYTPKNRQGYKSIIPLNDILSEIFNVGPKTKKVAKHYNMAIEHLGSELEILLERNIKDIEKAGIPLLAEAVDRMRRGEIKVSPGFDGEYGRVKIFDEGEKDNLKGERNIFFIPSDKSISDENSLKVNSTNKGKNIIPAKPKINVQAGKQVKRRVNKEANKEANTELKAELAKEIMPADKTYGSAELLTETAIYSTETEFKDANLSIKESGTGIKESETNQFLQGLNKEQRRAVLTFGHPVIIEAGPGTGKTRTLTAKTAWLISGKNVRPESILALTFTNRAAQEMKQRISDLTGHETKTSVCTVTFHSFCLMVLKEYGDFNFSIADDTTRKELIAQAFHHVTAENGQKKKTGLLKRIDRMISTAKQNCLNPGDNLESITGSCEESLQLSEIWLEYQKLLSYQRSVDFEDLIVMTLNLFQSDENVIKKIRQRFLYVFVDEYQDINMGQYLLTRKLAGNGTNLFVIGDPDQSIYGFRGSDNRYFKKFVKDYPNAEKISLRRNYRSTDTILEASFQMITGQKITDQNKTNKNSGSNKNTENQIIPCRITTNSGKTDYNTKEKIYSDIKGRSRVMIMESASDKAEAVAVGKTIERLTGGISMFSMDTGKADASDAGKFSFADFAVLYRTKNQSRIFAEIFEKAGIPFQTADRDNFLSEKGIKELISIIKTLLKKGSVNDFRTAIEILSITGKTRPGKKTMEKLVQWLYSLDYFPGNAVSILAKDFPLKIRKNYAQSIASGALALKILAEKIKGKNAADLIKITAEDSGIISTINSDDKIKGIYANIVLEAENFSGSSSDFMESIALKRDTEILKPDAEKVSLMTMHAAKGLEFPVVFVTGCESGLLPLTYFKQDPVDVEEERRLLYVAMTRAKEILCFTYAKKRRIYNQIIAKGKSPFLNDIEDKLKENVKNQAKTKKNKKGVLSGQQLDLFG